MDAPTYRIEPAHRVLAKLGRALSKYSNEFSM